jgi:hypothetical protein
MSYLLNPQPLIGSLTFKLLGLKMVSWHEILHMRKGEYGPTSHEFINHVVNIHVEKTWQMKGNLVL